MNLTLTNLMKNQYLYVNNYSQRQIFYGIYNEIRNATSALYQAQKIALDAYLEKLRKEWFDHQTIRYGREVILTYEGLAQQCH